LKKRSKKLLVFGASLATKLRQEAKVFWFFFSKKNIFLIRTAMFAAHAATPLD
jgi:hypothetical protein